MVSDTKVIITIKKFHYCLNPYSTGRWFLILYDDDYSDEDDRVLILILLEDGF